MNDPLMNPTLKELLKPPFYFYCGYLFVGEPQSMKRLMKMFLDEGDLLHESGLCHAFMDFTVAALNNQYERDYGEKLRWVIWNLKGTDRWFATCPKCEFDMTLNGNPSKDYIQRKLCYCPSCGQRLLPPEEEER
ncbi:MAG: hypothetical protein LBH07_07670 [Treponema sp.]|jgi:hypothetical protein|nr:hypothetical protein [Treponema sp.]